MYARHHDALSDGIAVGSEARAAGDAMVRVAFGQTRQIIADPAAIRPDLFHGLREQLGRVVGEGGVAVGEDAIPLAIRVHECLYFGARVRGGERRADIDAVGERTWRDGLPAISTHEIGG